MAVVRVGVDKIYQFVFLRKTYVSMLPKRPSGESFAGCRYEFETAGKIEKDLIGSSGVIEHEVPLTARSAELRVWDHPEDKPQVWSLDIGVRLTVDTFEGVRWRLENLGFDCGGESCEGPATRKAARAFMEWLGLMSARDEFNRTQALEQEMDLTPEFRQALDTAYRRGAGLHHGAALAGDDQLPSQKGP